MGPTVSAGSSTYWFTRTPIIYVYWDFSTGGSWVGKYGKTSRWVASEPNKTSPYFGTMSGGTHWVWSTNSSDPAALQTSDGSSRIAASWYTTNALTVPITFSGNDQVHRVSLFFVDFENLGLEQYIDFVDSAGNVTLSISLASFESPGVYLFFDIKGSTALRLRPKVGKYATISGLFVD